MLKGKVAIISGAAQGIGESCARLFAQEGAKVVLGDILEAEVQRVAASIRAAGGEALALRADVADPSSVQDFVANAVDNFGQIDVCVANAGISRPKPFLDLTPDDWDTIIDVNLKGTFLLGQATAKAMVKMGTPGSIINMSSVNAVVAIEGIAAYCASKGGVNQLTKAMSVGLAQYGIRVNAIGPGTISTEMVTGRATADSTRMQL